MNTGSKPNIKKLGQKIRESRDAKKNIDFGKNDLHDYWLSLFQVHILKLNGCIFANANECTSEKQETRRSSWRRVLLRDSGAWVALSTCIWLHLRTPFPRSAAGRSQCNPHGTSADSKPYCSFYLFIVCSFPKEVWRKKSELPITWIKAAVVVGRPAWT